MDHFDLAQRLIGTKEVAGVVDNPQIVAMLRLDDDWPESDEVPWCSAFVNWICWFARLPRSKSLRARSWLRVGRRVELDQAKHGDVVVLKRGKGEQPGPDVIKAPGHVGFYAGRFDDFVEVLGGNQKNSVRVSRYPIEDILGIRRVAA